MCVLLHACATFESRCRRASLSILPQAAETRSRPRANIPGSLSSKTVVHRLFPDTAIWCRRSEARYRSATRWAGLAAVRTLEHKSSMWPSRALGLSRTYATASDIALFSGISRSRRTENKASSSSPSTASRAKKAGSSVPAPCSLWLGGTVGGSQARLSLTGNEAR